MEHAEDGVSDAGRVPRCYAGIGVFLERLFLGIPCRLPRTHRCHSLRASYRVFKSSIESILFGFFNYYILLICSKVGRKIRTGHNVLIIIELFISWSCCVESSSTLLICSVLRVFEIWIIMHCNCLTIFPTGNDRYSGKFASNCTNAFSIY